MSDNKPTVPTIATAYLLADGDAVFLTAEDTWDTDIGKAFIADTPEKLQQLQKQLAKADRDAVIVDGYEVQVAIDGKSITPVKMREQFRILREPTVDYLKAHSAGGDNAESAAKLVA